jgi:hypothetical protein
MCNSFALKFIPHIRSKACWFQKHGYPYILSVIDQMHPHPTLLKTQAVREALQ